MKAQAQLIFKKVAFSEKKNLFREIAGDRVQIAVKAEEEIFHLIAVQAEKDELLFCHLTADAKNIEKSPKVLGNFSFGTERYFFQTELTLEKGWAILRIDVDLFQLQRRANARFDLPKEFGALFILTHHNGKSFFVECPLVDISAGGFKMQVPGDHPEFQVGDQLRGSLRLGSRRPMEFQVEVRFAQKKEIKDKSLHLVGVQFRSVDILLENRLLSLMMDLQREIFLKYPKKS